MILTLQSRTLQILEPQVQTLSVASICICVFLFRQSPLCGPATQRQSTPHKKNRSLSELIRVGKDQKFHLAQTDDTQANNTGKGTQANEIRVTCTVIRSWSRMNAYLM